MLAFFVNLFAAVCYFARIVANATCTPGFLMFTGAETKPDIQELKFAIPLFIRPALSIPPSSRSVHLLHSLTLFTLLRMGTSSNVSQPLHT